MTETTTLWSCLARRCLWRNSYALTRKLRRTSLKTMLLLAEGKCRLISDLYELISRRRTLAWRSGSDPATIFSSFLRKTDCSKVTRAVIQSPSSLRRHSWRCAYVLTRKLHRALLKTMWLLAEEKCQLISELHEPRACYENW